MQDANTGGAAAPSLFSGNRRGEADSHADRMLDRLAHWGDAHVQLNDMHHDRIGTGNHIQIGAFIESLIDQPFSRSPI
jgi:hypothetical protein